VKRKLKGKEITTLESKGEMNKCPFLFYWHCTKQSKSGNSVWAKYGPIRIGGAQRVKICCDCHDPWPGLSVVHQTPFWYSSKTIKYCPSLLKRTGRV
jgi:hypothetical protein